MKRIYFAGRTLPWWGVFLIISNGLEIAFNINGWWACVLVGAGVWLLMTSWERR